MSALKTHLFHGLVDTGYTFDDWLTIKLEDETGYKTDLLFRFEEWRNSFGSKMSVRFWVTDVPASFEDAQEGFIRHVTGASSTGLEANHYQYSEWTSGCDYECELKVGGHDLIAEMRQHKGKHAWVELSAPQGGSK